MARGASEKIKRVQRGGCTFNKKRLIYIDNQRFTFSVPPP